MDSQQPTFDKSVHRDAQILRRVGVAEAQKAFAPLAKIDSGRQRYSCFLQNLQREF